MNAYFKLTWMQFKLFGREPVALFFTLAFPLMILLLFGMIFGNAIDPQYGADMAISTPWFPAYRHYHRHGGLDDDPCCHRHGLRTEDFAPLQSDPHAAPGVPGCRYYHARVYSLIGLVILILLRCWCLICALAGIGFTCSRAFCSVHSLLRRWAISWLVFRRRAASPRWWGKSSISP